MTLIILVSLLLTISLPLVVMLMESNRARLNLRDDGAWTLARALLGGVHISWRPDPTPIVWFEVEERPARVHAYQRAGEPGWWIEGRAYLGAPLHFAARLTSPAAAPLSPSLPGFISYEPSKDHPSLQEDLKSFGIETNDRKRLESCMLAGNFRGVLTSLISGLGLTQCEVLLLNQLIIVRGHAPKDRHPGDVIERSGPQLAEALRALSEPLLQIISQSRQPRLSAQECPATAIILNEERWRCDQCGTRLHRTAVELLRGCCEPSCEGAIDGVHPSVILSTRTTKEEREVDVQDLPALSSALNLDPSQATLLPAESEAATRAPVAVSLFKGGA